jgi:predicted phage baseplate assembly protein
MSSIAPDEYRNHTEQQGFAAFDCFDRPPKPSDALLIGLSEPVPSCVLSLRFTCEIKGIGVDPRNPPIVWEAWCGDSWLPCEVDRDETGGLNRPGEVVLLIPPGHTASVLARQRAGWVRCRVVPSTEGQPAYSASPGIMGLEVATVGGTVEAINATEVTGEVLGTSSGVAGQRFTLTRAPVVPGSEPLVVETSTDGEWLTWQSVDDFAGSGPDDRHMILDPTAGEVMFGPAVRLPDGSIEQAGAVPEKGATIRVPAYRTGGGVAGNVASGALTVLKSSVPYVGRVENRRAASGGVDGETIDEAKTRGPLTLRTQGRAVTKEDYEQLAQAVAPEVARVRCLDVREGDGGSGVRVLVVPAAADGELGALQIEQLIPSEESLAHIRDTLDERRPIGARIVVEPPVYMGVTVVARVRARPGVQPTRLQTGAVEALNRYFHPISGGPEGDGWPFGRPVLAGDVFGVLQRLRGTELVEDVRLFAADVIEGTRGAVTTRIDLDANALVLSYNHQVMVEAS